MNSEAKQLQEHTEIQLQDIVAGKVFIRLKDGQSVNVMSDPESFDKAISEYLELLDRATWPIEQRCTLLYGARGVVPVYRLVEGKEIG